MQKYPCGMAILHTSFITNGATRELLQWITCQRTSTTKPKITGHWFRWRVVHCRWKFGRINSTTAAQSTLDTARTGPVGWMFGEFSPPPNYGWCVRYISHYLGNDSMRAQWSTRQCRVLRDSAGGQWETEGNKPGAVLLIWPFGKSSQGGPSPELPLHFVSEGSSWFSPKEYTKSGGVQAIRTQKQKGSYFTS